MHEIEEGERMTLEVMENKDDWRVMSDEEVQKSLNEGFNNLKRIKREIRKQMEETKHFSIDFDSMTFTQKLDCFTQTVFPQITKEESDLIAEICTWPDDTRNAFMFAKRLFEDEDIK